MPRLPLTTIRSYAARSLTRATCPEGDVWTWVPQTSTWLRERDGAQLSGKRLADWFASLGASDARSARVARVSKEPARRAEAEERFEAELAKFGRAGLLARLRGKN